MREWNFTIETETPAYFWNRVILYINTHDRRLDTQEHGLLEVEPLGKLKHPNPDPETAILWQGGTILGLVLDSLDPDRLSTAEDFDAFFNWLGDPDSDGPKTLYLPQRVPVAGCMMAPLGAHRLTVRMWTHMPEAIPYVTGLLEGLGYPEIAAQSGESEDQGGPPPKPQGGTEAQAYLFKSIKDAHPEYSYARVARQATGREKAKADRGQRTREYKWWNVRDAYKAMGWQWERADKVR